VETVEAVDCWPRLRRPADLGRLHGFCLEQFLLLCLAR